MMVQKVAMLPKSLNSKIFFVQNYKNIYNSEGREKVKANII